MIIIIDANNERNRGDFLLISYLIKYKLNLNLKNSYSRFFEMNCGNGYLLIFCRKILILTLLSAMRSYTTRLGDLRRPV